MKEVLNNFGIVSNRRSGTHFLWETLNANFDIRKPDWYPGVDGVEAFKAHCTPDQVQQFFNKSLEEFINDYFCVYIMRDIKDTLAASWYYWKRGAEDNLDISRGLVGKTFSEYIRGATIEEALHYNIDVNSLYVNNYLDPVQYWIDFTKWSDYIYTITFEDLKLNPTKVVKDFSNRFNIRTKAGECKLINRLVGNLPRKGVIGDWKNVFNEKDKEYVVSKAGVIMKKFGYGVD